MKIEILNSLQGYKFKDVATFINIEFLEITLFAITYYTDTQNITNLETCIVSKEHCFIICLLGIELAIEFNV
jgi:hypothetical protein